MVTGRSRLVSGEHIRMTMLTLVGSSESTNGTDQVDDQVRPQSEANADARDAKVEEEVQEEEKKSATG